MDWSFSQGSQLCFVAGAVALAAAWLLRRGPGDHRAGSVSPAMLSVALWSFVCGLHQAAVQDEQRIVWISLEAAIGGSIPYLLFLSVSRRFGREGRLSPLRTRLLWLPVILNAALILTDRWHHWYWSGSGTDRLSAGTSLSAAGPGFYAYLTYVALLMVLAGHVLVRQVARSSGWDRSHALAISVSIFLPLAAFAADATLDSGSGSPRLLPLGFALCGLLILSAEVMDRQRRATQRMAQLEGDIRSLHLEIDNRLRLEDDLQDIQDSLATHLAEQINNLAGLYNLILLASQPLEVDELLNQALKRLLALLRCDAIGVFLIGKDGLELKVSRGMSPATADAVRHVSAEGALIGFDVLAIVDASQDFPLANAIRNAGHEAALCKCLVMPDKVPATLTALWRTGRAFAVEDIALFSALTDELSVILENSRLRRLAAEAAIVEERRRLARDLHDSVAQSLHSMAMSAETARQVGRTQPDRLDGILTHMVISARQAVREMRLLVYELRTMAPETPTLLTAIQHRLDGVERRAGIHAALVVEDGAEWPPEWETELYSIILEALNNSIKHARASDVEVRLKGRGDTFEVSVSDDGCGFDPADVAKRRGGMGLATMAERAQRLHGRIDLSSVPGRGTRLSFLTSGKPAQITTQADDLAAQVSP